MKMNEGSRISAVYMLTIHFQSQSDNDFFLQIDNNEMNQPRFFLF